MNADEVKKRDGLLSPDLFSEEQVLPAVSESRRFTLPEFLILLSLCADRHILSPVETGGLLTRETVIPAVRDLLLGGLLSMSGEHYILSEQGHRWMDGIGRSDRIAVLSSVQDPGQMLFLYYRSTEDATPEEEITAVQCVAEDESIEISRFCAQDLEELLVGRGLLPELPDYRQDISRQPQTAAAPEGQILPGPEDPISDWRQIEGAESFAAILAADPDRVETVLLARVIALRSEGRLLLGTETAPGQAGRGEQGEGSAKGGEIRWLADSRAARILTGREVMQL